VPEVQATPAWRRGELAWPLSLFAGFAGAWAGLASGVPGLALLLSTAAVAPLFLGFQSRGEPKSAFLAALGGALGGAGAVLGAVFEGGAPEAFSALLGSRWLAGQLTGLLDGAPRPRPLLMALQHAGALAIAVSLARPTRGLSALALALGLFEAMAAGVGERALAAPRLGGERLLAVVVSWPPGVLAEGLAALALGTCLSIPRGAPLPGRLLRLGIACAAAALVAWALGRPWGRLAARAVGLEMPWG
jgi:hypothetical protein